jgi:hypothetical protein
LCFTVAPRLIIGAVYKQLGEKMKVHYTVISHCHLYNRSSSSPWSNLDHNSFHYIPMFDSAWRAVTLQVFFFLLSLSCLWSPKNRLIGNIFHELVILSRIVLYSTGSVAGHFEGSLYSDCFCAQHNSTWYYTCTILESCSSKPYTSIYSYYGRKIYVWTQSMLMMYVERYGI